MAKSFKQWTVLPHGPLEQLEPNLWRVEGSLPSMPLKRVMTIAKLASGGLVVHNPICIDDPKALEALGTVEFIVVPNGWHRQDLAAFHARYPTAHVLAAPGAKKKVAEVDAGVEDLTVLPPNPDVALEPLDGMNQMEVVMTVRTVGVPSLVFGDAVFNMPHLTGFHGFVLRHITGSSGGPKTSRIARLFMIKDKRAFAAHLERLATPDLRRAIVAHHEVIVDDPAGTLKRIAASL